MLFHVVIEVSLPHQMDRGELDRLGQLEHERAAALQRAGKWKHLWRIAGRFANVSVFDVQDPAELHAILESLPFYRFMRIDVTALCKHPGALAQE